MTRNQIIDEYNEWLFDSVGPHRFAEHSSYWRLITRLHETEFRYSIRNDENRAQDGIDLRYRFALKCGYEYSYDFVMECLHGPCSVLEMMVALAIRCEEHIMDDPDIGDRTQQWFWNMIVNLGLGSMTDDRYDEDFVDRRIETFLNREYEPNGKGGLFTVDNARRDLRNVEIWYQLCWYLNNIVA